VLEGGVFLVGANAVELKSELSGLLLLGLELELLLVDLGAPGARVERPGLMAFAKLFELQAGLAELVLKGALSPF